MTSKATDTSQISAASRVSGPQGAVNEPLLLVAERELKIALLQQERRGAGLYARPTRAEQTALDQAVRAVCAEAHRLDLRAEELLIAVKQAWSLLAPTRARHLGDRDGEVLRQFVTSSIEVFFEPHDRTE
jgi:hypothetical protein